MKIPIAALVLSLLLGCAKTQPVALYMDNQQGGEAGHYVVITQKGDQPLKLYDCLARPDGSEWRPTCKEATLRD